MHHVNAECPMPNAQGESPKERLTLARVVNAVSQPAVQRVTMPAYDINERTFEFACAIVNFYFHLLRGTKTPPRIANQILGSGTAPAILEEAEAAHSRADFVARISTSLKEAREVRFWLRLVRRTGLAPEPRIAPHLDESTELIRILTTIRKNAGHRPKDR